MQSWLVRVYNDRLISSVTECTGPLELGAGMTAPAKSCIASRGHRRAIHALRSPRSKSSRSQVASPGSRKRRQAVCSSETSARMSPSASKAAA